MKPRLRVGTAAIIDRPRNPRLTSAGLYGNGDLVDPRILNTPSLIASIILYGANIHRHYCLRHSGILRHLQTEYAALLEHTTLKPDTELHLTLLQAAAAFGSPEVVRYLLEAGVDVAYNAHPFGMSALQAGVIRGNLEIVSHLLMWGADPNDHGVDQDYFAGVCIYTPLAAAAKLRDSMFVHNLLNHGANVNYESPEGGTALRHAILRKDVLIVRKLINASADVNRPDRDGRTALYFAVEARESESVKMLLQAGAKVETGADIPVLRLAAARGDIRIVRMLLKAGANIDEAGTARHGAMTPLQAAAGEGRVEMIKILLEEGADLNAPPAATLRGRTALQAAAWTGQLAVVRLLLEEGAEVNEAPARHSGRTALQAAAGGGHEEICDVLLGAGADINAAACTAAGRTALQAAAENGNARIVKILLDAGAKVDVPLALFSDKTALQAAAGGGFTEVVKLLVESGANVNPSAGTMVKRSTPLEAAAEGGYDDIVRILVQAGANIHEVLQDGRTALQTASFYGYVDIVRILLGADAEDPDGFSKAAALRTSAAQGDADIVKLLLSTEVDANAISNRGKTALQLAVEGGHTAVVQALAISGKSLKLKGCNSALFLACARHHTEIVDVLLTSYRANVNSRDRYGRSPLHVTVADKHCPEAIVKCLLKRGAKVDFTNAENRTPLHVALQINSQRFTQLLLQKGASTAGISLKHIRNCLQVQPGRFLVLSEQSDAYAMKTRSVSVSRLPTGQCRWGHKTPGTCSVNHPVIHETTHLPVNPRRKSLKEPMVRCNVSAWGVERPKSIITFSADPEGLLPRLGAPLGDDTDTSTTHAVHFWGQSNHTVRTQYRWTKGIGFLQGIPNPDAALWAPDEVNGHEEQFDTELIGYISLNYYGVTSRRSGMGFFEYPQPDSSILWVMKRLLIEKARVGEEGESHAAVVLWRSVEFRSEMNHFWIPESGIEFVRLFVTHTAENWGRIFAAAKLHLRARRRQILESKGRYDTIDGLLEDSQTCERFLEGVQDHVDKFREILREFHDNIVLCQETWQEYEPNYELEPYHVPKRNDDLKRTKAIKELDTEIDGLEGACMKKIDDLKKQTMEMIELEFNLVSIHESRRSIETSVSMKRLSWITFVFLPLMFVASIFGMNVDTLESNPPWFWYPVWAVPMMGMVLGVWIVFKYLPLEDWISRNVGGKIEDQLRRRTNDGQPRRAQTESGRAGYY